jgi:hypothetical protein
MKKVNFKIKALALAAILVTFSCSKLEDFGDTNVNPAATNNPITSALLTNVLTGSGDLANNRVTALYCQYFSETQYPEVSCYADNMASPMATYSGSLYDLQNIIINNTDAATKDVAALNGAKH